MEKRCPPGSIQETKGEGLKSFQEFQDSTPVGKLKRLLAKSNDPEKLIRDADKLSLKPKRTNLNDPILFVAYDAHGIERCGSISTSYDLAEHKAVREAEELIAKFPEYGNIENWRFVWQIISE
jgi:hypothetical protein